ncbi:MAG: hypothetical protein UX20_C0007G0016 [Candidatus Magasanikbacteria bacterium GW2011_GWC2_45_8]|uniref:Uncharacterized protein n=1 Tax=Candidatus Magasanikbacteria bacterium GW2011_GWC2_45_8 TaxID=1619050 RepID=A0A0G1Q8H2_9BACT|nr:MAG: hypothetical protein UX20_C0007G0016 [Candidatus Magasanikbacteria bacterium GW2011_GWC2_45_8]HBW73830.1 hypothetical protein [Candidatus Magasanikbacteria bacterium]
MRKNKIVIFAILFSIIFVAIRSFNVSADVMSSDNYKIFSDVLSVGGAYSISSNYGLSDTVGEILVNPTSSTSSNFEIQSGFWGMSSSSILSVSFDTNSINLGTLSKTEVNTASQTMTVTTNAYAGFTTTIQVSGSLSSGTDTITAVSDGAVSAGSVEYGIRTSGTNAQMNSSDYGLSASAQTLAQTTSAIIADQTVVTYKASISGSTGAGSYGQTVTFTTTANF